MIDLCIPYIKQGKEYAKHLIEGARSLAVGPINVICSYHDEDDFDSLEDLDVKRVYAKPYPDAIFYASANHSSAIEALTKETTAEYIVFCDSDMAFLRKGWDQEIKGILDKTPVCGVSYPPIQTQFRIKALLRVAPWLEHVQAAKYQHCPNLSFFGITRQFLTEGFNGKLTDFHNYLNNGGFPFRIVSTPDMANAAKLQYGSFQWMDTGVEIPDVLYKHNIEPVCFEYASPTQYLKRPELADTELLIAPELFTHGKPFLYHFKKGSRKQEVGAKYTFEQFKEDVSWLVQSV